MYDEIKERVLYYEEKEAENIWAAAKWFSPKENLESQFTTLILEHHTKGLNLVEDEIIEEYKKLRSI